MRFTTRTAQRPWGAPKERNDAMSNTKRSMRMVSVAFAVLASTTLASTAITTAAASATTSQSSVNQCSETYIPTGDNHGFRTWFFGKTDIRIRNAGTSNWAFVQWSDGPDTGEVDIPPGGTSDLNRGFVGLRVTIHPWYSNGVYVSFPHGPC